MSHTVYGIVRIDATGGLLPAWKKPHHRATGRQRQDASGATVCRSGVEHDATSGRTERERKLALYCARNLIERFFNKIKQFARIATWTKLTCRSSVGRCYHPAESRSE